MFHNSYSGGLGDGSHRLGKVWVELQHVVELLLQRSRLQSFVLIILQKIGLVEDGKTQVPSSFHTRCWWFHFYHCVFLKTMAPIRFSSLQP